MRLIIIPENVQRSRTARLSSLHFVLAAILFCSVLAGAAGLGYQQASKHYEALPADLLAEWHAEMNLLREQSQALHDLAGQERQAYTLRLAALQARVVRLDALGERLTDIAGLDNGEFNFKAEPAVGGPHAVAEVSDIALPELNELLARLDQRLQDRTVQLQVLEGLMANRRLQTETYLAGRPILKGWMSSAYGRRTDPFHGGQAWHQGVDFAGREGASVVAVAAGVVTWSGERNGYGEMIEISHADGYVTRYAHNQENLAPVGETVNKGQTIARMGSSGRSTGPHVHFEVLRNGKAVNPTSYINRASR